VKEYLSRKGLAYRDVDVSRDPAAANEMVRISGQRGVPVTVVDGQAVVGFDRPRLDALLRSRNASPQRPRLGAAVADAAAMSRQGRTQQTTGAYVGSVRPDSPAGRAALLVDDVIVSLGGAPISDAASLERAVGAQAIGAAIPVTVIREGQRFELTLTLTA